MNEHQESPSCLERRNIPTCDEDLIKMGPKVNVTNCTPNNLKIKNVRNLINVSDKDIVKCSTELEHSVNLNVESSWFGKLI